MCTSRFRKLIKSDVYDTDVVLFHCKHRDIFALYKINTFQFFAQRCCEFKVTDSLYYIVCVSVFHLQRGVEIRIKAVSHANRIRAVRVG